MSRPGYAGAVFIFGIIGILSAVYAKENATAAKPYAIPQIQSTEQFTALVEKNPNKLLAFDLYADWCGPCRLLSPTLTQIAAEKSDKVTFYKINVDKFPEISQLFGVSGIPVVAFVKHRQTVFSLMGLQPREAYVRAIETYSADSAINKSAAPGSVVQNLSATEARDVIARLKPLVLDVRTATEYAAGHLPQARLIPVAELPNRLIEIAAYKTKPVLVYCRSGNRSAAAAEILIKNGFKNVYNLQQGLTGWKQNRGAISTGN